MFDTDYMEEFDKIIDSIHPKYRCIKDYQTIKVNDIATVKIKINAIHNTICVTSQRHAYYINALTLDKYFIKLGKEE